MLVVSACVQVFVWCVVCCILKCHGVCVWFTHVRTNRGHRCLTWLKCRIFDMADVEGLLAQLRRVEEHLKRVVDVGGLEEFMGEFEAYCYLDAFYDC